MIRVVVLGSAAAIPSKKHLPSCLAVKYGGVYLFDACEGVQRQMMKYGVSYSKLKAVFLSHLHADHWIGLLGLTQTLNMFERRDPLLVFGPRGSRKLLETIFETRELTPHFAIVVKDVSEKSDSVILEEKLFTITAFPVEHNAPALGFALQEREKTKFDEAKARARGIHGKLFSEIMEKGRLAVKGKTIKLSEVTFKEEGKKIVFSGDTMPCASVARAARGADLLVHDACFTENEKETAKEKAHSTAREAAELAKKAGVRKLLLTHFSNRYEDDRSVLLKEAREVFENVALAEEGLEVLV